MVQNWKHGNQTNNLVYSPKLSFNLIQNHLSFKMICMYLVIWRFILIAFYCKTILLSTIVSTCARLELRYIMGISKRKIIIGKKKSSTMYTFSYFRKMASISPFFLCSSKRLSKWSSLTFGFAWLNFQGPNKPFKHKLKFPLEPWGQTLNYVAIDFLQSHLFGRDT